MFSKEEEKKIKIIIKEEIKKKNLENSKIEVIEKILKFLTNKNENISSILGNADLILNEKTFYRNKMYY